MTSPARRIGVVHPYWSFWESAIEHDFAEDRRCLAALAVVTLKETAEIAWSVTVQPGDDTDAVVAGLARNIHAIVVVSTMAASPSAVLAVLAAFPTTPVVIWATHEGLGVDPDFSHSGITLRGGTVGAPMIGAYLTRAGRPFDVIASEITNVGGVAPAVRRATAAGAVRTARLGVIGSTIPGYEWERVADDRLEALGIEVTAYDPSVLRDKVLTSAPDRTAMTGFTVDTQLSEADLDLAMRYSTALEEIIEEGRLSAGTLNCHVAELRLNPELGAAPCFALGRATSRGVPWTCTGDVATSLAMLLVSSLGAPTLYHEIEALDEITNEAILANSGEHDARFASADEKRVIVSPWFPSATATASALFSIAPGPASLVGVVSGPDGGLAVVVATGRFTDRTSPRTGTSNATFVFENGAVLESWSRWTATGVGHHSCATDRHVARDLEVVCRHLGIEFTEI